MASKNHQQKPYSLTYVGSGGAHLTGLPARDLTAEEVEKLEVPLIQEAIASGLYVQSPVGGES